MLREDIYFLVDKERLRQEAKHGNGSLRWLVSDDRKTLIILEELGEVAKAILEQDIENLKAELIQVAATCVAFLESFEDTNGEAQ